MQTLRISQDFKLLLEIIFHMQRVPDADKYAFLTKFPILNIIERFTITVLKHLYSFADATSKTVSVRNCSIMQ